MNFWTFMDRNVDGVFFLLVLFGFLGFTACLVSTEQDCDHKDHTHETP